MSAAYPRPLGMLRNAHARIRRAPQLSQAGKTPFEVIARHDIAQLRYYPYPPAPGSDTPKREPLVIVPPLAVNMLIYDLFPQRSLVAHLRDQGYPLYLIDWGRPSRAQAHYRLKTYLTQFMPAMLADVRQHSGQTRLSLHGWSMGAIFSYCYAALGDPDIHRLILLGPPCDYHAGNGSGRQNRALSRQLARIQQRTGWHVHRSPRALWHTPGWANSLGFKLMSPQGTLNGLLQLMQRLDDADYVAAHATNAAFLNDMVAYPGGVTQDILRFLVGDNVLAQGRLPIRDCPARLDQIQADVLMVIGDKDPIITPQASRRLAELMPHANCNILQVPGGHMSIVSGRDAPDKIWTPIQHWLARTELPA